MATRADLDALRAAVSAAEGGDPRAALDALRKIEAESQRGLISGPVDAVVSGVNRGALQLADMVVGNPIAGIANLAGADIQRDPITRTLQEAGVGRVDPENEASGRIGESVGASLIPGGAILKYARHAPRVLAPYVEQAVNSPGRFALSELAASLGAGTGGAIAREIEPGSMPAEMSASVIGGVAPGGVASGIRRTLAGAPRAAARNANIMSQAGVDPSVGQVGGTAAKVAEGALRVAPGSSGVSADIAARQADQLGERVAQLAPRVVDEEAGKAVERGINEFVRGADGGGGRMAVSGGLWDRLDQLVPDTTIVDMPQTRAIIAELRGTGRLAQDFANPIVKRAHATIEEFGDSMPYEELRGLRSFIGGKLGGSELISDVPKAELRRLYGALTDDIRAVAGGVDGGEQAFTRANTYTRALHDRIDSTLAPILKRTTPEKLFAAVKRSDPTTLVKLRRSLTPTQWRTVVDGVVSDLGTAVASKQDATGELFSPETFLTQWTKLGRSTRRALFGGRGFERMERDLNNVAEAANLMRRNAEMVANPSGTARASGLSGASATAATALMTGHVGVASAVVGTMAGFNATARMFAWPPFVRWLSVATNSAPSRLPVLLSRLVQTSGRAPEGVQQDIQAMVDSVKAP